MTAPEDRKALVELMADAHYDAECGENGVWQSTRRIAENDAFAANELDDQRCSMEAALDALEAAGCTVVPNKPTVNMNAALWQEGGLHGRFDTALQDVIAASPYRRKP